MFISEKMQCCNVDEILYGPHLAPQLLLVTLLSGTLFIYFLKKDVNKTIHNIHILLQSVSRQLIVWVGFTSSINHLYFLSCCRFLKQHFVSNNNDSLVNYFLRNFLHLVPKIFYLKNNKSQHSHEMALIAEN